MSYQRLYYSREELARQAPARLSWPAVSIGFLCFFALVAPPGFITAINLYLLLLVGIVWAAGQRAVERPLVLVTLPFGLMMVIGLVLGAGADRYLLTRIDEGAKDFSDGAPFFWTGFAPQWIDLLELFEATQDRRYLDAVSVRVHRSLGGRRQFG